VKKLIKATTDLLIKEGYNKTTIRRIDGKREYSLAAIYLYYKDKDKILTHPRERI
jgi:AcrR family transcriptional regulator